MSIVHQLQYRFRGLQNYTTLKPGYYCIVRYCSFRGLQNYTTLKLAHGSPPYLNRFRDLQNYTTLKPWRYVYENS